MRRVARLTTVALLAALTLTGCRPGGAPSPSATAGPSTTPHATETSSPPRPTQAPSGDVEPQLVDGHGDPIDVHLVDASTAAEAVEGVDYQTVAVYPQETGCTDAPLERAMFADGAWLVSFPPNGWCEWDGSGTLPASEGVGLLAPGTTDAQRWPATPAMGDGPRSVWSTATAGRWAVWSETDSTDDMTAPWRVFAGDRTTGEVHLVARSEELTGGAALPRWTPFFAVRDDQLYWSTAPASSVASVAEGQQWQPEVVSKPLSGDGEVRVVAPASDEPVATDQGIVVRTAVQLDVAAQSVVTSAVPTYTVESRQVAGGLALVTDHGLEPILAIAPDGPLAERVAVNDVSAHGPYVGFSVSDTAYLLDLRDNSVVGFRGTGPGVVYDSGTTDSVLGATQVNGTALTDDVFTWTYGGGLTTDTSPVFAYALDGHSLRRLLMKGNMGNVFASSDTTGWWEFADGIRMVRWT